MTWWWQFRLLLKNPEWACRRIRETFGWVSLLWAFAAVLYAVSGDWGRLILMGISAVVLCLVILGIEAKFNLKLRLAYEQEKQRGREANG